MIRLFAILVLLFVATPVQGQVYPSPAYEQAMEALRAGRYTEGLPEVRRAAAAGYPEAVYNLALMQQNGWGMPVDPEAALAGYQRALRLGYKRSRNAIAGMYRRGEGGPKRVAEALEVYRASAADGDPSGAFGLATMYDAGDGVARNPALALHHFKQAADLGSGRGAFNAGQMLLAGETGVARDAKAAIPYLEASARQGIPAAYNALGYVYRSGAAGTVDYAKAKDWFYKGEAEGDPGSSALLDQFERHARDEMNDLQSLGRHELAFSAASQLCNLRDDYGCYTYGNYLLHGADGVVANPGAALSVLAGVCRDRPEFGCDSFHYGVVSHGQFATRRDIVKTRDFFEARCRPQYKTESECHALALLYYYPGFGLQSPQRAKELSVQSCFNRGYQPICPMAYEIVNYEARQARTQVRRPSAQDNFFGGLGNFLAGLGEGLAAASASGYSYSQRTYSSGGQTAIQLYDYENSAQAERDFQNAMRATNNIGTAYDSSCRPGNPYC